MLAPGQYVALNAEGEKSSKWPRTQLRRRRLAFARRAPGRPGAPRRRSTSASAARAVLHVGELVRFENEGYLVHMDIAFAVKSKKAAKQVLKGLATGHEKGLEKLAAGPPVGFAGPISTGRLPADDDHRQARLVRAGVLHADAGRSAAHADRHGADHQDRQVAETVTRRPVPRRRGAGPARRRSGARSRVRLRSAPAAARGSVASSRRRASPRRDARPARAPPACRTAGRSRRSRCPARPAARRLRAPARAERSSRSRRARAARAR